MEDSEKLFPRPFGERVKEYYYDKAPSFLLNGCFAVVVMLIVAITITTVALTANPVETQPQQTVVKVYLNENDSIIPILKDEMKAIKNKLDSIRQDSLAVEISKIKK